MKHSGSIKGYLLLTLLVAVAALLVSSFARSLSRREHEAVSRPVAAEGLLTEEEAQDDTRQSHRATTLEGVM